MNYLPASVLCCRTAKPGAGLYQLLCWGRLSQSLRQRLKQLGERIQAECDELARGKHPQLPPVC